MSVSRMVFVNGVVMGEGKNTVSEKAIRDELSRILESSLFSQSDRLGRFLRFTVETTLMGKGETLKEYVIGTEVYDRQASYRPNEDSIVRSEARRLRSKLKEYYESVGKDDPVFIYYRPGSYVPVFRLHPQDGSATTTSAVPAVAANSRTQNVAVARGQEVMRLKALKPSRATATAEAREVRRDLVIPLAHGLHARPAARLADLAKGFAAEIVFTAGERRANAKSPVAVMGLGLVKGAAVTLIATGEDAEAALTAFAALIESGMGEAEAVLVKRAAVLDCLHKIIDDSTI